MNRTRPNVVIFFTDQQRWDSSGLHGNPLNLTPHFDRFAQAHTHVAQSFTCQPVCGPARACLQTGQYATTNGVYDNSYSLPKDRPLLAEQFRDAGYRTGYIGKWHLANDSDEHGPVAAEDRGGYQDWLAANILEFTSMPYDCVLYDEAGKPRKLPGYRSDACVDAAIRYVDEHQDEPFFLMLSVIEPHHQNALYDYTPPDGYREPYTDRWTPPDLRALEGTADQHLGGYWGAIKRVDEGFGRFMDALQSFGLDENTIVLFTSDHGCHFETRPGMDKRTWHESSARVPTAVMGPGFEGGGRVKELVSLVDLPATLLDAAGLDVPDTFQGRSIMPLLRGEKEAKEAWPDEAFIQPISNMVVARAVRTRRWKYAVRADGGLQEVGYSPDSYQEAELYDLKYDPYELSNLAGMKSHDRVCEVLRERLLHRMREVGEAEPTITPAASRGSGQRVVSETEAHQ